MDSLNGSGSIASIGIIGGTFDPIHKGHLAIAEEARVTPGLQKVIFIPTGNPWMKKNSQISPVKHRVEMVRLAIRNIPYFELSNVEAENEETSFTVDTLSKFRLSLIKKTNYIS